MLTTTVKLFANKRSNARASTILPNNMIYYSAYDARVPRHQHPGYLSATPNRLVAIRTSQHFMNITRMHQHNSRSDQNPVELLKRCGTIESNITQRKTSCQVSVTNDKLPKAIHNDMSYQVMRGNLSIFAWDLDDHTPSLWSTDYHHVSPQSWPMWIEHQNLPHKFAKSKNYMEYVTEMSIKNLWTIPDDMALSWRDAPRPLCPRGVQDEYIPGHHSTTYAKKRADSHPNGDCTNLCALKGPKRRKAMSTTRYQNPQSKANSSAFSTYFRSDRMIYKIYWWCIVMTTHGNREPHRQNSAWCEATSGNVLDAPLTNSTCICKTWRDQYYLSFSDGAFDYQETTPMILQFEFEVLLQVGIQILWMPVHSYHYPGAWPSA